MEVSGSGWGFGGGTNVNEHEGVFCVIFPISCQSTPPTRSHTSVLRLGGRGQKKPPFPPPYSAAQRASEHLVPASWVLCEVTTWKRNKKSTGVRVCQVGQPLLFVIHFDPWRNSSAGVGHGPSVRPFLVDTRTGRSFIQQTTLPTPTHTYTGPELRVGSAPPPTLAKHNV